MHGEQVVSVVVVSAEAFVVVSYCSCFVSVRAGVDRHRMRWLRCQRLC